jgi:Ca2+-binding EF-hand superfamily protein
MLKLHGEAEGSRLTKRTRRLEPIRPRKDINTGENKFKRDYAFLGRSQDPRKGVLDEELQGFPNGYFFNSTIKKERIYPTITEHARTREKSRMAKRNKMTAAQKMTHEQHVKTKTEHKKHMQMQNRSVHDTVFRRAGVWFNLLHAAAFKRANMKFSSVTEEYAANAVIRCSLDQMDLMRLKAQFMTMDTDKSGEMDYQEFQYLMDWEKLETYSEYISETMFRFVDRNHSRSLDFGEYVYLCCELCTYSYDQLLEFMFYSLFDTDGSGVLEQHEYLDMLSKLSARHVKKLPMRIEELLDKMKEQEKASERRKKQRKAAEMGVEFIAEMEDEGGDDMEAPPPQMDFLTFRDFCQRPRYSFMVKPMLELQKRMRIHSLGRARWKRACNFIKVTEYMKENDGAFPPMGLRQKAKTQLTMLFCYKHPYDDNVVALRRIQTNKVENKRYKRKLQQIWADDYKDVNEGELGCESRELNYTQNYFFRPHRMGIQAAAHGLKWRNLTKGVAGKESLCDAEKTKVVGPKKIFGEKNPSLGSC